MSVIDTSTKIVKLQEYAEGIGLEIKEQGGVTLWPTYDEKGALGTWFCMYVRSKPATTQEKTQ